MILSVVIVNFNVKYFLEQCLHTVRKAISGSAALRNHTEVFIVDNASTDASVSFLAPRYPGFHFIANAENRGFAAANNQVLPACSGEYILFLNPDTLIAEDSLDQCVSFFGRHPEAGALGVRMIDGSGNFLKESKRGFPTAPASFFKMCGLAAAFPSSRVFAAYYAGHLDPAADQAVEVLSGAFMMVRKTALEQSGPFDERFFMYAEDIDLSYRIRQAGFLNYYLASTSIIHFKGESTRKDLRYVRQFYLAMRQFMKKHSRDFRGGLLLQLLSLGISFRERLARAALRLPRKPGTEARGPVFIMESGQVPAGIPEALRLAGIPVAGQARDAESRLYCETPQYSFKSIIRDMDGMRPRIPCFIHGAGTGAAVGGSRGGERGETILLNIQAADETMFLPPS